jgi:hypothetical protein
MVMFVITGLVYYFRARVDTTLLGNCDICAELKISIMNEMTQYKIWLKPNILVKTNFIIYFKTLLKVSAKVGLNFVHFS